jgi:hypothetical protein
LLAQCRDPQLRLSVQLRQRCPSLVGVRFQGQCRLAGGVPQTGALSRPAPASAPLDDGAATT